VVCKQAACGDFITLTDKVLKTQNCLAGAKLCINIPFTDIANYKISDNGKPFVGNLADCGGANGTSVRVSSGKHKLVFTQKTTGCKDSINITVDCVKASFRSDTINMGQTDTVCIDLDQLEGKKVSIANLCKEDSGEFVQFNVIDGTNCLVCKGVDYGTEKACIIVCDANGTCDTTIMQITVRNPNALRPEAVIDVISVNQNKNVVINVLSNDNTHGTITDLIIALQPSHGSVVLQPDNKLIYVPKADYCGEDNFSYSICNAYGCDTTNVNVTVNCDDLIIYTGFSPNGDGINETFMIQGVDRYPNNKLLIFNRFGNQVFGTEKYDNTWKGTWNGKDLPDGTYFYIFDDGKGNKKSGYVELHR
jgi:gliding motility-associated-like protein